MALKLRNLIKNLANIRHKKTNENKFLKSKAKIQEFRENIIESTEEAKAIHNYIIEAEVEMDPNCATPLFEQNSFSGIINEIGDILSNVSGSLLAKGQQIKGLASEAQIGILTTSNNDRYLTTRRRANQLGGRFQPVDAALNRAKRNSGGGKIK